MFVVQPKEHALSHPDAKKIDIIGKWFPEGAFAE